MKKLSIRKLAQEWPYASHEDFEESLKKTAAKWFEKRGYKTQGGKKSYILAQSDKWLQNIIDPDVRDYVDSTLKKDDLHAWRHNGLSSQAMLFNLMGPLVKREDYDPLEKALASIGITWSAGKAPVACFEYKNHTIFNEDHLHPTSIDLYLKGEGGNLFIEAKLKEPDFGGCSIFARGDCEGRNPYPNDLDSCYLHYIGINYWNSLLKFGLDKTRLFNGPICPFANYYQFFREVMFALCNDGTFVLLHDERNPAFLRRAATGEPKGGLWPFLYESIPLRWQNRVGRLSIQALVKEIQETHRHDDWIYEFKAKYGME